MSLAIPVHVALVDTTGKVSPSDLAHVAGALNEQIQADVAPAWKLAATVGAYPKPPPGTWRIELHDTIPEEGAAGIHLDEHRQPYSLVAMADGDWTVTTSHELLEMLVDPFASRMHTAKLLDGWSGDAAPSRVRYLLEPGDPCETVSYEVGGVSVSDFVLPSFYRSSGHGADAVYSHTGAVKEPLEVLDGGYISFFGPDTLYQRFVKNGQDEDIAVAPETTGPEGRQLSLREIADRHSAAHRKGK